MGILPTSTSRNFKLSRRSSSPPPGSTFDPTSTKTSSSDLNRRLTAGMRRLPRGGLNWVKRGLVVVLTFLVINLYWTGHPSSSLSSGSTTSRTTAGTEDRLPYPIPPRRLFRGRLPITQVLAHAPGFTIFRDVYFQRGRYIILTDAPYEIPDDLGKIAFVENQPEGEPKPVELVEVRKPPIMGNMPEFLERDRFVTPEMALRRFDPGKVEVVEGISVSLGVLLVGKVETSDRIGGLN